MADRKGEEKPIIILNDKIWLVLETKRGYFIKMSERVDDNI